MDRKSYGFWLEQALEQATDKAEIAYIEELKTHYDAEDFALAEQTEDD